MAIYDESSARAVLCEECDHVEWFLGCRLVVDGACGGCWKNKPRD